MPQEFAALVFHFSAFELVDSWSNATKQIVKLQMVIATSTGTLTEGQDRLLLPSSTVTSYWLWNTALRSSSHILSAIQGRHTIVCWQCVLSRFLRQYWIWHHCTYPRMHSCTILCKESWDSGDHAGCESLPEQDVVRPAGHCHISLSWMKSASCVL